VSPRETMSFGRSQGHALRRPRRGDVRCPRATPSGRPTPFAIRDVARAGASLAHCDLDIAVLERLVTRGIAVVEHDSVHVDTLARRAAILDADAVYEGAGAIDRRLAVDVAVRAVGADDSENVQGVHVEGLGVILELLLAGGLPRRQTGVPPEGDLVAGERP